MKNNTFTPDYFKELVFVGLVTIVSMISVRYFLYNYHSFIINTPSFASDKSYDVQKTPEKQGLKASSY